MHICLGTSCEEYAFKKQVVSCSARLQINSVIGGTGMSYCQTVREPMVFNCLGISNNSPIVDL
jgi:hypothetical protein